MHAYNFYISTQKQSRALTSAPCEPQHYMYVSMGMRPHLTSKLLQPVEPVYHLPRCLPSWPPSCSMGMHFKISATRPYINPALHASIYTLASRNLITGTLFLKRLKTCLFPVQSNHTGSDAECSSARGAI